MKIALYRSTSMGFTSVRDADTEKYMSSTDVRVSRYVEVDFVMIPEAESVAAQAETMRDTSNKMLEAYKKVQATEETARVQTVSDTTGRTWGEEGQGPTLT